MCGSSKYSHFPNRKLLEIPNGRGFFKAKLVHRKNKAKLLLPEGWGVQTKTFCWVSMNIFRKNIMRKKCKKNDSPCCSKIPCYRQICLLAIIFYCICERFLCSWSGEETQNSEVFKMRGENYYNLWGSDQLVKRKLGEKKGS